LADSRRRVLLGTYDGEIVALAVGRAEVVGESSLGVIDACYVEPVAREVGVGKAVLDALVGWFTVIGCRAVDATALPGDRETKSFFESNGFKARMITFHRSLKDTER
jgi:GNAT superfamily N-acetyltransferase